MTLNAAITRRLSALALLVALGAVLAAPLWHQHHYHAPDGTDAQRSDLHVCNTGSHGKGPLGLCPTCLSQRLLNQAQAERGQEPPSTSGGTAFEIGTVTVASEEAPRIGRPRAPPRV
jgi:hypothetical protein